MNKKNITFLVVIVLLLNTVLSAQSVTEKLYLSRVQNIISTYSNNNFFLEFGVSCNGCIKGSNRESFFFIYDTNNGWFFKRIGLYSASKTISMWNLNEIIDFYNIQDSVLQYNGEDSVFNAPLWHEGRYYVIKIYNYNRLIFKQIISQYWLDSVSETIPICQYVNLLKQIIFDISIRFPYEYCPKRGYNTPQK